MSVDSMGLGPVTEKIVGYDIISHLPDHIIGHILGCMLLLDAVRTSVLSRAWRYKWLNVSKIVYFSRNYTIGAVAQDKLLSGILGVLEAHNGAILELCLLNFGMESCPKTDKILKHVCNKGVLKIWFGFGKGNPRVLDASFFSCSHLTNLFISKCVFQPPPEFTGFTKLVCLYLIQVTMADKVLSTLLYESALLECLVLASFPTFNDHLELATPYLKYFHCRVYFKTLLSVAAHCLVDVLIALPFPRTVNEIKNDSTVVQLKSVDSIVRLHLDYHYLKSLYRCNSRSIFKNLRVLRLSEICFGITHEVKCMLELMKHCASLEEIIIEAFHVATAEQQDDVKFCEALDLSCSRIHEVQMLDISGSKTELAFIETLLLKLPKLKTMVIAPDLKNVVPGGLEELVSQFPRASPLAAIEFRDSKDCQQSLRCQELQVITSHYKM